MAKTKITDYSTTPANNTEINNLAITGSSSLIYGNDAIQTLMAHLAETNAGTAPWADTMTIGDAADLTKKLRFELSGFTTATTRVLTPPNYNGTIATLDGTETFTNKTLTAATLGGTTNLSGGQIAFPAAQNASANANTLDDYEEGTSTPTLTPTAGSITTSTASLSYTKIGNRVFFSVAFTITNAGTGTGALNVTLPFTAGSAVAASGANIVSLIGATGIGSPGGASMGVLQVDGTTVIVSGRTYYLAGHYNV